jgi:regulator of replication initiation timing
MKVYAYSHHNEEKGTIDNQDTEDILDTVVSLRKEIHTMATDIQDVIQENIKLKEEVDILRQQRQHKNHLSDIQRMKQEIDQLVNLHQTVSARQTRSNPKTPGQIRDESASNEKAWMKKMMMFMMMSELV